MSARILVVEDNPSTRRLYEAILTLSGDYSVHTEERADDAVSYLKHGAKSDLIITDMDMPGGNGLDVLEQARVSLPGVPCMVCSGGLPEFNRREIEALGVDAILNKPFSVTELTSHVRNCLRSAVAY